MSPPRHSVRIQHLCRLSPPQARSLEVLAAAVSLSSSAGPSNCTQTNSTGAPTSVLSGHPDAPEDPLRQGEWLTSTHPRGMQTLGPGPAPPGPEQSGHCVWMGNSGTRALHQWLQPPSGVQGGYLHTVSFPDPASPYLGCLPCSYCVFWDHPDGCCPLPSPYLWVCLWENPNKDILTILPARSS